MTGLSVRWRQRMLSFGSTEVPKPNSLRCGHGTRSFGSRQRFESVTTHMQSDNFASSGLSAVVSSLFLRSWWFPLSSETRRYAGVVASAVPKRGCEEEKLKKWSKYLSSNCIEYIFLVFGDRPSVHLFKMGQSSAARCTENRSISLHILQCGCCYKPTPSPALHQFPCPVWRAVSRLVRWRHLIQTLVQYFGPCRTFLRKV